MHVLAKTNNGLLVRTFVELGACLDSLDVLHRTPLYTAAKYNGLNSAMVTLLPEDVGADQVRGEAVGPGPRWDVSAGVGPEPLPQAGAVGGRKGLMSECKGR